MGLPQVSQRPSIKAQILHESVFEAACVGLVGSPPGRRLHQEPWVVGEAQQELGRRSSACGQVCCVNNRVATLCSAQQKLT
jgi:hypothetical protein